MASLALDCATHFLLGWPEGSKCCPKYFVYAKRCEFLSLALKRCSDPESRQTQKKVVGHIAWVAAATLAACTSLAAHTDVAARTAAQADDCCPAQRSAYTFESESCKNIRIDTLL